MRKCGVAVAVAAMALSFGGRDATGCGDKLLALGRGVRYHAYVASHPASILIYATPNSPRPAAAGDLRLQSTLTKAGHKLKVVEGAAELEQALNSGQYDLVITGFADAVEIEALVRSAPSRPDLLPAVYRESKAEVAAAEKQHSCLLKSAKAEHYLSVIDRAMGLRLKRAKA